MASDSREKKRPVHELRLGRIKAAIWENDSQIGTRHNVTLQRLYVGDDGQWETSQSFGRDDLPLAVKVLDQAHSWIFEHAQEPRSQQTDKDIPY